MNKRIINIISYTVAWIFCFVFLGVYFPGTLIHIEATNPLLGTDDFLRESLLLPGGILEVMTVWLRQWFLFPWVGAGIVATLSVGCGWLVSLLLKKWNRSQPMSLGWGLAACCMAVFGGFPDLYLIVNAFVCLLLLNGYLSLRRGNACHPAFALLGLLAFPVIGVQSSFALFMAVLITDLQIKKTDALWAFLGLCFVLLFSWIWSHQVAFLNEEQSRIFLWESPASWLVLFPVLWMWIASAGMGFIKKESIWPDVVLGICAMVFLCVYYQGNLEMNVLEKRYCMEQAAECEEWGRLKELSAPDASSDGLALRYALLAESKQGTLGENLFKYPVRGTGDFYFWRMNQTEASLFNALFYKNIGVADEYMHQIFEMGTLVNPSMSARAIRHLTEAALMQRDRALARRYLYIAEKSQRNGRWLEKQRRVLNELLQKDRQDSLPQIPDRSAYLIGTHLPEPEFIMTSLNDTNNIERTRYMICSVLLEKDIRKFMEVLRVYRNQLPQRLDRIFTEGYLLAQTMHRGFQLPFQVTQEDLQRWVDFLTLREQGNIAELNRRYQDTYWYYYFYTQTEQKPGT